LQDLRGFSTIGGEEGWADTDLDPSYIVDLVGILAGFPLPIIGKIPNLEWVELAVKFFTLRLDA
jgi:hypothetical protein